ncbi:FAD-binding oxidoreductase [Streptosporangium brasiliense]|uniref:FAD/FMN-containing dehydrogenase n=1 Tax=Streptosporangium brasiliense TaxID=47480 RepID=A0ABT9RE68_9ACTN|nr:FAD-binding oxidoreductase [Streptosporangium brasiliense]MDP9867569.1 FAD/FMN-containing dehydrogenase [Streptosporangium brasiliense]
MTIGNELRNAVRGRVLVAGDEGFEQAGRPWNLAVEQPVRAVVEAEDADDVAAVVGYARLAGLAVAAQPSGHGASGSADGVILLRTGRLGDLEVRPAERVARVGAGVQWGQVLAAAGPHGLTGLAGSSPVVSVTGYTLGGGLSWFGRRHGFAADSVRAFEVVDAEGRRARVSAGSDPELFWALRGGGGDFALVTAVEFELYPAPRLYGGRVMWPAERAAEVLEAFREITADAPEELSVWFDLLSFPPLPFLPDLLRGKALVAVDATFLGEGGEGQDLLRRLDKIGGAVMDSRGVLPVAELGGICAEPTDPSPGMGHTELLTGLDDAVAQVLLSRPIDPLLSVQIRHLGGALARSAEGGGACGHLTEPYLLHTLGIPATAEVTAALGARQSEIDAALAPHVSGRRPHTFLSPGDSAATAFPGDVLARLREIKRARDPHGVFRSNYSVLG